MKRAGESVEVSYSYLFLAAEESSYFTGQVLHPNGHGGERMIDKRALTLRKNALKQSRNLRGKLRFLVQNQPGN